MRKCLQIVFYILLFYTYANSLELIGKVIKVSDGDTVTILTEDKVSHKIRLNDIDAPEKKQPFGNKSRDNLASYIAGEIITVKYKSKDKYGRILGTIYFENLDINLQQIKNGYAWVYKQYSKNQTYYQEEQKAKDLKKGLWIAKEPLAPWEYRKKRKSSN
mgnify:FL=1